MTNPVGPIRELRQLLVADPMPTSTRDCTHIHDAIASALGIKVELAEHVSWRLIQSAASQEDPPGKKQPLAATRHLLGMVQYPSGLDEQIPDMPPTVKSGAVCTIRGLQGAGLEFSFMPFAPHELSGQRLLLAAIAGGYGESRHALRDRNRVGALGHVANALWEEVERCATDPAVANQVLEEARRHAESSASSAQPPKPDARPGDSSSNRPPGDDPPIAGSVYQSPGVAMTTRRRWQLSVGAASAVMISVIALVFVAHDPTRPPEREAGADVGSESALSMPSPTTTSSPQPNAPEFQEGDDEYYKAGWGPGRQMYTVRQGGSPYPAFNAIRDNPKIGDERNFVALRPSNALPGDRFWSDDVWAEPGDRFLVRTYVSNSGQDSAEIVPAGRIQGARLRMGVSRGNREVSVFGRLTAVNARSVWDGARLHVDDGVDVRVLPGSILLESNAFPEVGLRLSDDVFQESIPLGYNKMDGVIRPGYKYALYITFELEAVSATVASTGPVT